MSKTNYLNNKDLLREIHKSKCSYCWFQSPQDKEYHAIVNSLEEIPKNIEKATQVFQEKTGSAPQSNSDLVFRVMTWNHIPNEPPQPPKSTKKNIKTILIWDEYLIGDEDEDIVIIPTSCPGKIRINFPPFEHHRLLENGGTTTVARSHWQGDLTTGTFSKTHGRITDDLGRMFMKLVERFGTRGNWRGYTYNDEMRATALLQLSFVGLQFDESKSNNPFGYYTTVLNNSFTRVLNSEKRNQDIRDDLLERNGLTPSFSRQMKNHAQFDSEKV